MWSVVCSRLVNSRLYVVMVRIRLVCSGYTCSYRYEVSKRSTPYGTLGEVPCFQEGDGGMFDSMKMRGKLGPVTKAALRRGAPPGGLQNIACSSCKARSPLI